ncbi:MAG TPA: acetyl-CoA carboxylase biotin carboxyl carrier protein [Pyrinomonadaceae bacterium]|jgi:acetyl-CoA carboxylase biotin carboxyl carrier protein|nr:acetyl-CoA carboxylase biotin carboxyl carrier protein [Pyrinomonadaceae bacterium]
MSDEKRPETPGSQPTGDTSSSGGGSGAATRQQPTDPRRSSGGGGGATGEVNNSGGMGGGRHSRRRHRPGGSSGERENQTPSRRTEPSINMDELRELADLITAQGFTEFELEKEGFRLRLSRNTYSHTPPQPTGSGTGSVIPFPAPPTAGTAATAQTQAPTPAPTGTHAPSTAAASALAEAPSAVEDLYKITSPIVGTFYRAPSPTSEVFVNQGSRVESETVVCIIEAMKLMNEIQAEVSGTIEKIYVENGQPVEYGQALFGVKKQ